MGCGVSAHQPNSPEALVTQLKDPDPQVRRNAAQKLGELGKTAVSYSSQLADALSDSDLEVRNRAGKSLVQLASFTENIRSLTPGIAKLLMHDVSLVQGDTHSTL